MPSCLVLDPVRSAELPLMEPASRLSQLGWRVVASHSLQALSAGLQFDLVLLHVGAELASGQRWMDVLRRCEPMPVLMLMDTPERLDKVLALELGADAVMLAPFDDDEVVARAQALARRLGADAGQPAEASLLRAWLRSAVDAGLWGLSASERLVLRALLDQPGRVMSRAELMSRTGLGAAGRHLNVVDLSVSRLRAKLEGSGIQGQGIRTLRGQGYVWAVAP